MIYLAGVLAYGASALAAVLALAVLWRERLRPGSVLLALGLGLFSVRELFSALAAGAVFQNQVQEWMRYRLMTQAMIPGVFIAASLGVARTNHAEFRSRWRPVIAAAFALPVGLLAWRWNTILAVISPVPLPSWLVPVDLPGVVLHGMFLVGTLLVLMNFEATLRASSGAARWQIKFLVLGTGVLFGVEVFLHSQVLLDSWIRTTLFPFGSAAVLVAVGLVSVCLVRRRVSPVSSYVSPSQFLNSVALVATGVYLLVIAGLDDFIRAIAGNNFAPFVAFVLGLVAIAAALLSSELQQRTRIFLNRVLRRPSYDYRKVWDTFTRHTNSVVAIEPLCAGITKTAAETFGCSVATLWLSRPGERRMVLGGSTALSPERAQSILASFAGGAPFIVAMDGHAARPLDLKRARVDDDTRELFRRMEARYAVALTTGSDEPIGWLTLDEPVTRGPFGVEDFALFKTLGDQSAATVENRRLTEELGRAKEMETFQTLSTFFVHDMKNLASRLSLVMQNLPAHYDKPDFRKDLLDTMSKSVAKIDSMTSRLSSISRGLELTPSECDMNALVSETLQSLSASMQASVSEDLHELPRVSLDREQIQKVLTNLILNAQEATGPSGSIRVRTSQENGWVLLSVQDDGCGMSRDFLSHQLFKPFQTTKKQGLGIGLFHSKKIVEAHGGRIEVDSVDGEGSTFRVLLPTARREESRIAR